MRNVKYQVITYVRNMSHLSKQDIQSVNTILAGKPKYEIQISRNATESGAGGYWLVASSLAGQSSPLSPTHTLTRQPLQPNTNRKLRNVIPKHYQRHSATSLLYYFIALPIFLSHILTKSKLSETNQSPPEIWNLKIKYQHKHKRGTVIHSLL